MPKTSVSLTVPRDCPQCQALHTVHFVTVFQDDVVMILRWRCRACTHEWPVNGEEPPMATPDSEHPVNWQIAASRQIRIRAVEIRRRSARLIQHTQELVALAEQLRVDGASTQSAPPSEH